MKPLPIFQGAEHQTFRWSGKRNGHVLLVHGFPGTPAEMRPLGQILNETGWNVEGILLPGFGPQIVSIGACRYQNWLRAIEERLTAIKRDHDPVALVGYSMGAALSIGVSAQNAPRALVLLAPFWRLGAGWRGLLLPVLKWAFPRFRPFEKADFTDPDVRRSIHSFAPDIDLDDPAMQATIRQLAIPSRVIDELRRAGQYAFRNAARVTTPTLIVQGNQDLLVRATDTRDLGQRFSGPVTYCEVQAGHDLLTAEGAHWQEMIQAVLEFIRPLEGL